MRTVDGSPSRLWFEGRFLALKGSCSTTRPSPIKWSSWTCMFVGDYFGMRMYVLIVSESGTRAVWGGDGRGLHSSLGHGKWRQADVCHTT